MGGAPIPSGGIGLSRKKKLSVLQLELTQCPQTLQPALTLHCRRQSGRG